MKILKNFIIMSAIAIMAFSSVSCGKDMKKKDDMKSELEKKYSREFELIEKETNTEPDTDRKISNNKYVYFRDKNGVEFKVTCTSRTGSITPTVKDWGYSDNYISEYLAKYGDDYTAGLKAAGIDTVIDKRHYDDDSDKNILMCIVNNYAQLDVLFGEIKKLDPPLSLYGIKNDIKSDNAVYYCGDVYIGASDNGEESIRQEYIDNVRQGNIKEQLSDEILSKYPAQELKVIVDGKDIKRFPENDSENGKYYISFHVYNTNEKNKAVSSSALEEFLVDMGCNGIKRTASGFEWIGGKINLFDGSFEVTNSDDKAAGDFYIHLYPEDIEKLFKSKVTVDPVHSCEFKIETQSLLGGNEFVISG